MTFINKVDHYSNLVQLFLTYMGEGYLNINEINLHNYVVIIT